MSAELLGLALGGIGGYIVGKTNQGIIQIPIQTTGQNLDAFAVFDLLVASQSKDYSITINASGKVVGVWFQFYNTQGLLSHSVTIEGSPVFKFAKGSENTIALHNIGVMIPANFPFSQGQVLKIASVNSDPDSPAPKGSHRVRVIVFVEYQVKA
jgi:hypothetical protein